MQRRLSLAHRIVTAFVLMTTGVAGLFSLTVWFAIAYVEHNLASDSLNRHLDFILADLQEGETPYIGPDMSYYSMTVGDDSALPDWLHGLSPGFHERSHAGKTYHIKVRDSGGRRHVLTADDNDFERKEAIMRAVVVVGFLSCVALAWALGTLLARTVIAPVVRLAGQVQHRDQLLPLAPNLAPDYAPDEVGKLAQAFDNTLDRLRMALERERMFTSDVSHELRTPLMVIASTCEVLLAGTALDARQQARVERIARSCADMQEQVETFLNLARAPSSHDGGTGGTTLAALAQEQLHHWQAEAAVRGLTLTLANHDHDHGHGHGQTHLYPTPLLRAVMSNLLRNALHYTDQGFVRIELHPGGFSVVDSGAGIPPQDRAHMFKPFTRGDENRGDGIGIGLSLVQRICNAQGWHIQLSEREGGGCEFRVRLQVGAPILNEVESKC